MKTSKYLFGLLFVCCVHGQAQTTAVPFLRIPGDASAAGRGATGIATSPDASALFYNSAKLPFAAEKGGVVLNYAPWMREWSSSSYLATAGGYGKISDNESIHGQVRYFKQGELQFKDASGNDLQTFKPNEFAVDFGYARKITSKLSLGVTLRYIRSSLGQLQQNGETFKAGNAIAADVSVYYDQKKTDGNGWSFGAQLSNLGSKISYTVSAANKDFLPANLGLGAAYTSILDADNSLQFSVDVNKLLVPVMPVDSAGVVKYRSRSLLSSYGASFSDDVFASIQLSAGAEYWYKKQFALRAGYHYEDKSRSDASYFSAGATVLYKDFGAHVAYMAAPKNNPLSNSVLFGLTFKFN